MMDQSKLKELKEHALTMRRDCARMFHKWGHGHFGGSFSCVEILSALYFHIMNVDPKNPQWPDRDRFLIGKGHAAAVLFSAMAHRGFFPVSWLDEYGDLGANLNTHPSMSRVPGLDFSSGSLGHGMPAAVGMAYAAKMDKKDYMTYVLLGDGECHEGMVWEGVMAAPQFKLDNLIAIVDRNRLCIAGNTEEWLALEPFGGKWQAFNWDVYDVDGHDIAALVAALEEAKANKNSKPKVIIANTVKGKGVSFMENDPAWHSNSITEEMYETILKEICNV